jgi:hypothetical protein
MRHQQPAAIVALIVGTATVVFAIANAVSVFPRGLIVLACVLLAAACAWYGGCDEASRACWDWRSQDWPSPARWS